MHLISSRATGYYKWILPIGWIGLILIFLVFALIGGFRSGWDGQNLMFLAVVIGMLIVGYLILRKLVFNLVDEAWDDGQALVIRNGGQEERIVLADISNVGYTAMMNPPRVTLSLRRPSTFGSAITFCAPLRFMPFSRSPVIDELIARIDAARRR